jgi:hypothetical protein
MAKKGLKVAALDEVQIETHEYETYLKLAYDAAEFPKPRTESGAIKELPTGEMEKLMLTNIVVTDDDLRLLAYQRAEATKNTIHSFGKIEPDRIFLVEPKTLGAQKNEKLRNSRVDFRIK